MIEVVAEAFAGLGHRLGDPAVLRRVLEFRSGDLGRALKAQPPKGLRPPEHFIYPTTTRNPRSWIGRYLDYIERTESDFGYHFWSAYAIVCSAMRRNLWLDMGSYTVYPAPYVMLIGPTAGRKTSAINHAQGMVGRMNEVITIREAHLHRTANFKGPVHTLQIKNLPSSDTSAEFISDKLMGTKKADYRLVERGVNSPVYDGSCGILICDEVARLLGKTNAGAPKIVITLTDLFGSPSERPAGTRKLGDRMMHDVALTVLAGSTAEWLRSDVTPSMMQGGFLGRWVFVVRPGRRARESRPPPPDPFLAHELAEELAALAMMKPRELPLTDRAVEWFDRWYNEMPEPDGGPLVNFAGRRHEHLLRLAMAIHVSENSPYKPLDIEALELALTILTHEEKAMPGLFDNIARDPDEDSREFIERRLLEIGGVDIAHSSLYKAVSYRIGSSRRFKEMMDDLVVRGAVKRKPTGNSRGSAYTHVRLLKKTAKRNAPPTKS